MKGYQECLRNRGHTTSGARFLLAIAPASLLAYVLGACDSITAPSASWTCNVTVMGGSRTGTGSATGSSQEAALS